MTNPKGSIRIGLLAIIVTTVATLVYLIVTGQGTAPVPSSSDESASVSSTPRASREQKTYTYKNEEYGFEITWLDSWNAWENYEVLEEQLINNAGRDFIFAVPTTSSNSDHYFRVFKIRILLKEAAGGDLSKGMTYINTDGTYDFYYTAAQDAPTGIDVTKLNVMAVIGGMKVLNKKSGAEPPGWEKYGFEFQYPASWGEVEWGESFATDPEFSRVRGLRHPDLGGMFVGNFKENERCGFGGVTTDYSFGSEPNFYEFAGWIEKDGIYYNLRGANGKMVPDEVMSINTGKALIYHIEPALNTEEEPYGLDYEILFALLNLSNPIFKGLSVFCIGLPESPEVSADNRQGFYQILSTFEFTR